MVDDAESFAKVARIVKDRGAYKVFVMATHGILSNDAPSLIEDSCIDEVCPSVCVLVSAYYLCRKTQAHMYFVIDSFSLHL